MDLKEIAIAWTNAMVKPEEIQVLANHRMEVCDACEFKKKELGVEVCGKCYCPLFAKVYSPYYSCPEGRWPA